MLFWFLLVTNFWDNKIELKCDKMPFYMLHLSSVQADGSLILLSKYEAFHFDKEGRLLLSFGGRGDGPGEFQRIVGVVWTGDKYIALDGRRTDATILNSKGEYLGRNRFMGYGIKQVGDKLFASNYQPILSNQKDGNPLCEVQLSKQNELNFADSCFHEIRKEIFDFHLNFKKFFLTKDKSRYYVMDEFRRDVTVLNENYQKVGQLGLEIYGYVEPKDPWPRDTPRKQYMRNMYASSWVRMFEKIKGGFFVSLWMPVQDDADSNQVSNQLVNDDGTSRVTDLTLVGMSIGVHENVIYSVSEDDEFRYFLHKYKVP